MGQGNKDLFFKHKFTDRGGKEVYDVFPADDHMTMLTNMGEIRIDPEVVTLDWDKGNENECG